MTGQDKTKKKTGRGMGPAPLGGSRKRGKVPARRKPPCWQGDQPRGQKESFRGSEESTTTSLQQAEQREPCRGGLYQYLVCASLRSTQPKIHRQAGTQGLEDKPRERTAAGCADSLKGQECITAATQLGLGGRGMYLQKSRPGIEAQYYC